jgi:dTDP-glucose 4,6-dehydratase
MKTILVTGGCGFIASNFINYLLKLDNYKVINVDKLDYCSSTNNILTEYDPILKTIKPRNIKNYTFYKCDINNTEFISHILNEHGVDIVYHFAAQSHVDNSFNNVQSFINDNIQGTCSLLQCVKEYNKNSTNGTNCSKLEKFIHVSTDEVYGELVNSDHEFTEGFYAPTNPYAASKASAELIVKSYAKSYKLPIIITRSNNVYGINQYTEKVIPKFIKMIYDGNKCPVYGNGGAMRKYLNVQDACEAYYKIMEHGKLNYVYEMGTEDEYNTLDLLKEILSIMKPNESFENYIEYTPDRLFHDVRYLVNNKNIKELNWEPKINFKDGLSSVIDWYINYALPFNHWVGTLINLD